MQLHLQNMYKECLSLYFRKYVIFQFIIYYLFSELRAVFVCFHNKGNEFAVLW